MATPVNFAASPPLASGDGRDHHAPALAAGAQFGNHAERAALETETRKRIREVDPNAVTADEVRNSKVRQIAIEVTEAQVEYGVGQGGNAAAVAALGNQITNLAANLGNQITNLAANLGNQITDLRNQITDLLGSRITNVRRREQMRAGIWVPILVENDGPNPVGVAPATFPANRQAVIALTHTQINALEAAYNLQQGRFGLPADALSQRRERVLDYFLEG